MCVAFSLFSHFSYVSPTRDHEQRQKRQNNLEIGQGISLSLKAPVEKQPRDQNPPAKIALLPPQPKHCRSHQKSIAEKTYNKGRKCEWVPRPLTRQCSQQGNSKRVPLEDEAQRSLLFLAPSRAFKGILYDPEEFVSSQRSPHRQTQVLTLIGRRKFQ